MITNRYTSTAASGSLRQSLPTEERCYRFSVICAAVHESLCGTEAKTSAVQQLRQLSHGTAAVATGYGHHWGNFCVKAISNKNGLPHQFGAQVHAVVFRSHSVMA